MQVLVEGRSARFRERFLGTHFFNPPRYLHLLEIIPTPDTRPTTLAAVRALQRAGPRQGDRSRRTSRASSPTASACTAWCCAIRMLEEFGLTIDEVDALTGPLLGRAKSATFRTADLSGLDVLATSPRA